MFLPNWNYAPLVANCDENYDLAGDASDLSISYDDFDCW